MKSNNWKYSWLLVFLLLPGCGGGSMGTGFRTLGNKKIDDSPTLPKVPRLFAGVAGCALNDGAQTSRFSAETEFGGAKTDLPSDGSCIFLLPKQAESLEVYSSWLENLDSVSVSTTQDNFEVPLGTFTVDQGSLSLSRIRWNRRDQLEVILTRLDSRSIHLKFRRSN